MDKTARSLPLMSEEWVVKMKLDENVESHPALEGKDGQLAVGASVNPCWRTPAPAWLIQLP